MPRNNKLWVPENDYIFKEGKYAGVSMSYLMFANYSYLRGLFELIINKAKNLTVQEQNQTDLEAYLKLSKSIDSKSELHQHLEFFLNAGETIGKKKTKVVCPYCGQRQVSHFAFVNNYGYGFIINPKKIFCSSKENHNVCFHSVKRATKNMARRLFKFSVFSITSNKLQPDYYKKYYYPDVYNLFKKVFRLPDFNNLNSKIAFDFFTVK